MGDPHDPWQVEGSAPEVYERRLVPAMTAAWADDLIEHAGIAAGARVLDVACGTGVVARRAAEQVGPTGRVAAVDLIAAMLAVARTVPAGRGARIEWREASALDLPYADHAFDFVLCQFGLQFFPDRPTALREMHRTLAPGGLLAASVFGPIEHNPATYALANALDRHLGPGSSVVKRAEHALADPIELRALVTSERFRDATVMTRTLTVRFRSAQEYVAVQLTATPLAALASSVDPLTRDRLVGDVGRALAPYAGETGLAFPQEVHVVLARA